MNNSVESNENAGVDTEHDRGAWCEAYSGSKYFPLDFKAEEIVTEDILRGLAYQTRFNGQCRSFYSVAQHSVIMSHIAEGEHGRDAARHALMHDAPEAYIGDMIRPLKYQMPDFLKIDKRIWEEISRRYSLPIKMPMWLKELDNRMLATEKRDLLPYSSEWVGLSEEMAFKNVIIHPQPPDMTILHITDRFRELFPEEEVVDPGY